MVFPNDYKRIVLHERPVAEIEPTTFRTEVLPFDLKPGNEEVLVQVTWISLDPAMRSYIRDVRSYLPPVQIGEVRVYLDAVFKVDAKRLLQTMRAMGLGVVVAVGPGSKFSVGDVVSGAWGKFNYVLLPSRRNLRVGQG
jgi:NADPH-dependent curcumin reductase CurA